VIPYQEEEIKVTKESEDCIIVEWFGLHSQIADSIFPGRTLASVFAGTLTEYQGG
jgi:hypothetical protein